MRRPTRAAHPGRTRTRTALGLLEMAVVLVGVMALASGGWWWMDRQRLEAEAQAVESTAAALQRQLQTPDVTAPAQRWGTTEADASSWVAGQAARMTSATVAHVGSAVQTPNPATASAGASHWISVFASRRTSQRADSRWCVAGSSLERPRCGTPSPLLASGLSAQRVPRVLWASAPSAATSPDAATPDGSWPRLILDAPLVAQWAARLSSAPAGGAAEADVPPAVFARVVDATGTPRSDATATVVALTDGSREVRVSPSRTAAAPGTSLTSDQLRELVAEGDLQLELVLASSTGDLGRSYLDLTPAVDPFAVALDGPVTLTQGETSTWSVTGAEDPGTIIVWEASINGTPLECIGGPVGLTCALAPNTAGTLRLDAQITRMGFGSVSLSRHVDVTSAVGDVDLPPTAVLRATPDTVIRGSGTVLLDASASDDDRTVSTALVFAWELPGVELPPLGPSASLTLTQTDLASDTLKTVSVIVLDERWQSARRSLTLRRQDLRTVVRTISGDAQTVRLTQQTPAPVVLEAKGFFGQLLPNLRLVVTGPGRVLPSDTLTTDASGRIQMRLEAPANGRDSLVYTVTALDRTPEDAPPAQITVRIAASSAGLDSLTLAGLDTVVRLRTVALGKTLYQPAGPPTAPRPTSEMWTSSNPAVATVDTMGVVTGVAEGSATITLTVTTPEAPGFRAATRSASRTIRVTPAIPALSAISIIGPDSVKALRTASFQETVVLHPEVPAAYGTGIARWSLEPADTAFASVDSLTGMLTGKQPGMVRLTLTVQAPLAPGFDRRALSTNRLVVIGQGDPGITSLTGSPRAVRVAVGDTLRVSELPLALLQPGGAPLATMTYQLADSTSVVLRPDAGPLRLIGRALGSTTLRVIATTPEAGPFLAASDTTVLTIQTGLSGEPQDLVVIGGNAQTGVRGQPLGQSVRYELRDARSRPVPGMGLEAILSPAGSTILPTSLVTDAAGQVAITWRLDTLPGSQTLRVRVATDTIIWRTATATAVYGTATTVTQTAAWRPTPLQIGDSVSGPDVIVRDAFGQAVRGTPTPLRVVVLPPSLRPTTWAAVRDSARLLGAPQTVDTTGQGRLTLPPFRGTAGWWRLGVAMAPGGTVAAGAVLTLLEDSVWVAPGPVARLVPTRGDTTAPTVGRPGAPIALSAQPQARAEDAEGNPIPGQAVVFFRSPSADPTPAVTDSTGTVAFAALQLPLPPRSADTVTLRVPGAAGERVAPLRWAFEARDPIYEVINPVSTPQVPRGATIDVAVRVLDPQTWTPLAGLALRYRPRSGDGTVAGTGEDVTDSTGVATVSWTLAQRLGLQQLGIEDIEQPAGGTKIEIWIEAIEAQAGGLAWQRAPSGTYRLGEPVSPTLQIVVRDHTGDGGTAVRVAGRPVQLRVVKTGGDALASPVLMGRDVALTDTLGVATFTDLTFRGHLDTLPTAIYTLEASTPGVPGVLTAPLTLAPGRGHHLVGVRGIAQLTPAPGTPLDSVVVSVRDAWNNPVAGDSVRFVPRNTGAFVLRSLVRNTPATGFADPQLWMAGAAFEPQVLVAQLPGSGGAIRDSLRIVTGTSPAVIRLLRDGTPWAPGDTVVTGPNGWVSGTWQARVRDLADTPMPGVVVELRVEDPAADFILGADTTAVAQMGGTLRAVTDASGLVTFSWRLRTPTKELQRLVARVREIPSTGAAEVRVRVAGAVVVAGLREVVTGRLVQRRGELRDRAVFLQVDAQGRPVRRAGEFYPVWELDEMWETTWMMRARGFAISDSLGQVAVQAPTSGWVLDRLGTSRVYLTRTVGGITTTGMGDPVTVIPGLPVELEVPGTFATWRDALRPYLLVGATHPAVPLVVRSAHGDSVPGATLRWRPSGRLQWERISTNANGIVVLPSWTMQPHWARDLGGTLRPWLRLEVEVQPQGGSGGPFPVILRDSVEMSVPAALSIGAYSFTPAPSGYHLGPDTDGTSPLRITTQLLVEGYFGERVEGVTVRLSASPAGSHVPTIVTTDADGLTTLFTWEMPRTLGTDVTAELRAHLGPETLADMPLALTQVFRLLPPASAVGTYQLAPDSLAMSACVWDPTAWCATHEPVGGQLVLTAADAWSMTLQLRDRLLGDTSTVMLGGEGPGQWELVETFVATATVTSQPITPLSLEMLTRVVGPQVTSRLTTLHGGGHLTFTLMPADATSPRTMGVVLRGYPLSFEAQP